MTTEGRLLGGRLIYRQPTSGFRSGIEPILLAAAVPAKPGERVLEAGTGAAAALLCLHARVPGVQSVGVEVDADMVRLAAENAAENGFTGLQIVGGRIETTSISSIFDHAIANPPYHARSGTASFNVAKDVAKRGSDSLIQVWVTCLSRHLRNRGSLTLIVPSGMLPACVAAMAGSDCRCSVIYPLWPKDGRAAKLVMVRGTRRSRAPLRMAPGLVLHQPDGRFSETAQGVLRDGAALLIE